MSERTWIKIHNGLTNDPAHRAKMGIRIWLFMWLVDHSNWTNGVVEFYSDALCAAEMSDGETKVFPRTIERQRQDLETDGYITCHKGQQCQHIRIMKWKNPRLVNPPTINIPDEPDTWLGYASPRTHPHRNLRTPSISDSQEDTPRPAIFTVYEQNIGMLTSIIADDLKEIEATFPAGWFEDAVKEAVRANARNLKYVWAILKRWQTEGRGNGNGKTKERRSEYERFTE